MNLWDKLEKRLNFIAVPNVVLTLIVAQLFIYAAILVGRLDLTSIILVPKAVLAGEWWRLFSFLISPPYLADTLFQALFLSFFWYIFWVMSQTLEQEWGIFRFNLYLLCSVMFSVLGAFIGQIISPQTTLYVMPEFLYLSTFFAFATVNPNMQFLIMFVIPMKVKWIAWIMVALGVLTVLSLPSMGHRIAFVAPYLSFALFFKGALNQHIQSNKRRRKFEFERRESEESPLHTCVECGATDKQHPERDFRYKVLQGETSCVCNNCRKN